MQSFRDFLAQLELNESRFQDMIHHNPSISAIKNLAKGSPHATVRFTASPDGKHVRVGDANKYIHYDLGSEPGGINGYIFHSETGPPTFNKAEGEFGDHWRENPFVKHLEKHGFVGPRKKVSPQTKPKKWTDDDEKVLAALKESRFQDGIVHNPTAEQIKALARGSPDNEARFVVLKDDHVAAGDSFKYIHSQLSGGEVSKIYGHVWHQNGKYTHRVFGDAGANGSRQHPFVQHLEKHGIKYYYAEDITESRFQETVHVNPSIATMKSLAKVKGGARFTVDHKGQVKAGAAYMFVHNELDPDSYSKDANGNWTNDRPAIQGFVHHNDTLGYHWTAREDIDHPYLDHLTKHGIKPHWEQPQAKKYVK
jgi:hypothetical protein